MKKLFVANWKMNKTREEVLRFRERFATLVGSVEGAEIVLAPSFPFFIELADSSGRWSIAGQNCSSEKDGALTGEVSAAMLASCGCRYVILGHSERRRDFAESGAVLGRKVDRARESGLVPIFCVGETLDDRREGRTREVLARQLEELGGDPAGRPLVVAYEPVWAIGTGQIATPEQAEESIAEIRRRLAGRSEIRVLYGGSAGPGNASALLRRPGIDGFLVGGASLDPESFLAICRS
ncbi:MAG: triose-phosphate isomerase [Thermoanaerobaculia bacterium]